MLGVGVAQKYNSKELSTMTRNNDLQGDNKAVEGTASIKVWERADFDVRTNSTYSETYEVV